MKHITCEYKGCGKTFSHETRGSCEQALRLHMQRKHLRSTIPPGTEGKPRKSNHDINEFLSAAESRGLDATAVDIGGQPIIAPATRKYTKKVKETVEVTVNFCPNCGCNLHSVAVGMAMTRGS